jgi:hypothetical protein
MLPEATSERDQHSPHHLHRLLHHSNSLPHHHQQDTTVPRDWTLNSFLQRVGGERPSVYTSPASETSAPLITQIAHITTQRPVIVDRVRPVPSCGATCGQPPLFSVSRRSLTPNGPSLCLTPTHQMRQRISRHCPSPTSHNALISQGRPSVFPPSRMLEHLPTRPPGCA